MKKGKKLSYEELEWQLAEAEATIKALTGKKQAVQSTGDSLSSLGVEEENDISLVECPNETKEWMPLPGNFLVVKNLLANVNHELRTPLNTILGQTEILQEQIFGSLNAKQMKSVNTIETSGRHLLAIVNNLLDMAQSEVGQLTINLSPLVLQDICQASLAIIKPAATNKQLKIILNFDHSVSTILADKHRLKQMLVHLLINAVKFTPQGGQIGLEITGEAKKKIVTLSVWDTGIGMSKESLHQLFHPFVQLDNDLSRQYEGTGLGLALVCRLTELHGGYLSVQSEKDKGSRFTITLPWQEESNWFDIEDEMGEYRFEDKRVGNRVEEKIAESTAIKSQSVSTAAPLVLLAENNENNITTISDFLKFQGYRVIVARDGIETIKQAKKACPQVILMDVQMPKINGLEASRQIRANDVTATIPIIVMTTLSKREVGKQSLEEAGINDCLSKPLSLKELLGSIKNQCQGQLVVA